MSEMIERVARAITKADGDDPDGSTGNLLNESEVWWQHRIPLARAAIEAMREPPKQLQDAAWETADESVIYWWQTMIGAALNGSKTPSE